MQIGTGTNLTLCSCDVVTPGHDRAGQTDTEEGQGRLGDDIDTEGNGRGDDDGSQGVRDDMAEQRLHLRRAYRLGSVHKLEMFDLQHCSAGDPRELRPSKGG